jgi:AcrR family transcriptional regulator
VYSNFKGKDDRFLAVLDAGARRRFPLHTELIRLAPSIEDGLRASAREMVQYAWDHPGWTGVYVGGLVAGWAARWGVEFRLPAREVVGGIYAISRGMGLEALLADERDSGEQFEELPTLPKATLMDNFDRTVTEPRLRRIAAVDGRSGAVPPPIEVTPVPEIERDPGHGAKLKLVRSVVPRG